LLLSPLPVCRLRHLPLRTASRRHCWYYCWYYYDVILAFTRMSRCCHYYWASWDITCRHYAIMKLLFSFHYAFDINYWYCYTY
jgi:hypothetical protein